MVRENDYHFNSVKDPGGELTDEQLKEVYEFWKPYEFCYKCKPDIQRHFSVASGRFDPSYVPLAVYKFTRRYWAHAIENFMVNKNYLSWDFAIDRDGTPVLIELNGIGGQFSLQLFGKHTFINAEITKKLLDDWILRQFSYRRASWNWNFREYSDHIEITKYDGIYTSVTVPDKMNGKPVTVIKNGAFSNGKMIIISLPSSIVKIEKNAFTNAGKACQIVKR